MNYINVEIKLDKKKCMDKAYFEKMLTKFSREVQRSEVMETLRLKRCHLKPSALRKHKKQIRHKKWKFY